MPSCVAPAMITNALFYCSGLTTGDAGVRAKGNWQFGKGSGGFLGFKNRCYSWEITTSACWFEFRDGCLPAGTGSELLIILLKVEGGGGVRGKCQSLGS